MRVRFITFSVCLLSLLLSATAHAQSEERERAMGGASRQGFNIQLLAGLSSLKVLPKFCFEGEDCDVPRISMNTYGFRFGKRNPSAISASTFWELSFSTSKGELDLGSSELPYDVSNTLIGGAFGMWIPLSEPSDSTALHPSPGAILLELKLGFDAMLLRIEDDDSGLGGYFGGLEPRDIETGDWALFSIGVGLDFVVTRNVILGLEFQGGFYPVSGPGDSAGQPTGPPDEWGHNRLFLLALTYLL